MRKIICSLLCLFLLFGCKKDKLSSYKDQFAGKWEYVRYSGYPFTPTALPPGNGKIIVFTKDGIFEQRNNDAIISKGKYNLEEKKDCYGNEDLIFLNTTDPSFAQNSIISAAGDSLLISTSNCLQDGGTTVYRKL